MFYAQNHDLILNEYEMTESLQHSGPEIKKKSNSENFENFVKPIFLLNLCKRISKNWR